MKHPVTIALYLLSHTRCCASQSWTEVLLQEKYVNSMWVRLLLWRYLRTVWRHQIEDRWQTSFVLSSIIYLSIYIYLSGVAGERQTPPRLLTATATALCGDRGDGVNSWVAATPSPATSYRNKITYIVRSVWTTTVATIQASYIQSEVAKFKRNPSPVAFYYCPICMLYVQLPASWIQCNEHWTVWMIFQSYHHMTESLKTCSYKKVWVNFCIEIGLKKCQLHFLRIALHKVITRELE